MVLSIARFSASFSAVFTLCIILGSLKVAEWPPFGKELLIQLTICPLCLMFICNFGFEDIFFSDCARFWSLIVFCF